MVLRLDNSSEPNSRAARLSAPGTERSHFAKQVGQMHELLRRIRFIASFVVGMTLFAGEASAQIIQLGSSGQVGERFANLTARPAPRSPDGKISLGPYPGEIGMWLPFSGATERVVNPDNLDAAAAAQYPDRPSM